MSKFEIDLAQIRKNGIFVMIPAYAGQCFAAFGRSMMQLAALCTHHQIPLETFYIYNESLIPRARNYCADAFLNRKFKIQDDAGNITEHYFQHGMFIDTDIEFNALDVLVLAHFQNTREDFDIVCGPYSRKVLPWEKIKVAVEKGLGDDDPHDLEKYSADYVFNSVEGKPIKVHEPAEVMESGTGFMMFRRDTLLKVAEDNPDLKYLPDHARTASFDGSREITAFFHCAIHPESKRYLSEDYFFCWKARESGMKIWLVPWLELKHHGYYIFGGSLPAMAQAGLPASVDTTMIKKK